MRRRALLAASNPSGGEIILTPNATTEDNKGAYELFMSEGVVDFAGTIDWFPENSETIVYISGTIYNVTFNRVLIKHASSYDKGLGFNIHFDGLHSLGSTMVAYLSSNGQFDVYDDD